jgi:hypothetical protein
MAGVLGRHTDYKGRKIDTDALERRAAPSYMSCMRYLYNGFFVRGALHP